MRHLIIATALLAPISAYAADACSKSEIDCLAQVYAERLVQEQLKSAQLEAHVRFTAPHETPPPPASTAYPDAKMPAPVPMPPDPETK